MSYSNQKIIEKKEVDITRSMIDHAANILAAKKNFDPPTPLSVGLHNSIEKEELLPYVFSSRFE
jgi:hypothetical protein